MSEGLLSITTYPAPLAVSVLDARLNVVVQSVSPTLNLRLASGLYLVVASRPAEADLVAAALVIGNATRSVHLSAEVPGTVQRVSAGVSRSIDRFVRGIATPVLTMAQQLEPPQRAPEMGSIWVRFVWLYDWDTAEVLQPPSMTSRLEPDRVVFELTNSQTRVTFMQIKGAGGPPLNVALPPGGVTRPVRFEVIVLRGLSGLTAKVQLSTPWVNSALQYMAQGSLDQARRVVDEAARDQPSGQFTWFYRFEDPAAALVERYVSLRTGASPIANLPEERLISPAQILADELILTAEAFARKGDDLSAYRQLMRIRMGSLPLYTDGFSLLTNRLRELLENSVGSSHADKLDEAAIANLRSLRKAIAKWTPYVDMSSPTLAFPGEDINAPKLASAVTPSVESAGWLLVGERSTIESVQSVLRPRVLTAPVPKPVAIEETWGPASSELLAEIDKFTRACILRYRLNQRLQNSLTAITLLASFVVIAAGVYRTPLFIVVGGGVTATLLGAQHALNFERRAMWYRTLISEGRNLSTDVKNSRINTTETVQRLNSLIRKEAAESIESPRTKSKSAVHEAEKLRRS